MGSVAYIVKIHHRLDLCAAILKIRLLRVSIRNIAPNHRPWHSAEPVVRLAQARNAGCADGDGITKRGREFLLFAEPVHSNPKRASQSLLAGVRHQHEAATIASCQASPRSHASPEATDT